MAAAGFLTIAVFQVALALGAPLGRAAWGGTRDRLPTGLRIASGVAAVVWVLAALIVLGRGGFEIAALPSSFVRTGTWVLVAVLPLGALMNIASRSRWERFFWAPFGIVLTGLCLVLALSDASG